MSYGEPPEEIVSLDLDWHEYMHYLYLPVVMPGTPGVRLPDRLRFLREIVYEALRRENHVGAFTEDRYVYVTARHGYASPGNPLNRPGWHCDGFGTEDVNYIWTDRFPTRFATGDFGVVSEDHVLSAKHFDALCGAAIGYGGVFAYHAGTIEINEAEPNTLYRLDPFVVHSTPIIPAPGGERSFLKISFSRDKYNLRGNSHNHLFGYEWHMWDRAEIRNDPAYAGGDAGPQREETSA